MRLEVIWLQFSVHIIFRQITETRGSTRRRRHVKRFWGLGKSPKRNDDKHLLHSAMLAFGMLKKFKLRKQRG